MFDITPIDLTDGIPSGRTIRIGFLAAAFLFDVAVLAAIVGIWSLALWLVG